MKYTTAVAAIDLTVGSLIKSPMSAVLRLKWDVAGKKGVGLPVAKAGGSEPRGPVTKAASRV